MALRLGGNGRQIPWEEHRQNCLWIEFFDSIPETSRSSVETCTWAIWRGTMQFGGQIWTAQAGSCSTVPLAGKFLLLISLLTWLSTSIQSLEHLIEGSTKLVQVKTGQGDYLECNIPDSLHYLSSGCLTCFQCFQGHRGSSWITSYISPRHGMLGDFASSRDLKLTFICGLSWLVQ